MLHVVRDFSRLSIVRRGKFVTTWKTDNAGTSNADQITLPLHSTGTYDFWVDWGDGGVPERIQAWNAAAKTHTYAAGAGTYTVTIWGKINTWNFNNGGDKLKILSIVSWGPLRLGNLGGYFYGCANLTIPATDTLDMTGTTDLSYAFRGCAAITTFPSLATLDTSQVTNTSRMFYGCTNFNDSVSNFDTSKTTDTSEMFRDCFSFNQSVSNFNTSNVTTMLQMFYNCQVFNQSVSNFNTAKVINMHAMFYNCQAFNQSLSNFDTAKVTTMVGMFYNCRAFNQDVSNFNTAKVTTMYYMFQSCIVFNQDVSGWDVQLVTTMADMFNGANALSTANYDALLVAWAAQVVKNNVPFHAGDALYTVGGLVDAARSRLTAAVHGGYAWTITDGGAGSGTRFVTSWKTNNAGTSNADQITLPLEATGTYDFWVDWGDGGAAERIQAWNAAATTHTYAAGAGTYTVTIWGTIQGWRFNNGADKLKILSITSWGPLRLGNSGGYFYGCSNLTIPATDTLDMTGTTTLYRAFSYCAAITTFPSLATLDTSQVTSMKEMFFWATSFNDSVSNFDTSEVIDMSGVFNICLLFNQSVANFNTAKVISMNRMFQRCRAFNQSLANFDTSKVTDMEQMFYQCDIFNQSLSTFDTSKVTNMNSMFTEALVFNQDVSGWDVRLVTTMLNMFNNSNALSTANYDALLVAWAAQAVKNNVPFHAGDAKYTGGGAAAAGRAHLAAAVPGGHAWTITDGGAV